MTRRQWLKRAGLALGTATLRTRAARGAEPAGPVMTALSGYMAGAAARVLPDEVIEHTKRHVLDTFAAMVSGAELPPGRFAIRFAAAHAGERVATVVGSDVVCGASDAALANGILAHADETDDSHAPSLSHPGAAVVPAALAAGEQFGTDGARFLRSVALGYDVGPRITMAMGRTAPMVEGHKSTHSIAGVFGAAAAAACVAGLNSQQMRWLLDFTAQESSGIAVWQRDTDHIEKAFAFAGMPARGGVTAALLVQAGATGVDDVFSGADNFFDAYAPNADRGKLVDQLGERYEVTRTGIKKWTVGSPIQASLDAFENLRLKRQFEADQVKTVTVRVAASEAAVVDNREIPDICLQHMIAVMLLDKTASFKAAHDAARMKDPAILRERAKVVLVRDEELERRLPVREAIVEIVFADGTRATERVINVRGTAENPMTREEVVAKARDLMTPVLGAGACARLIDATFTLERFQDVRALRPLLQKRSA